MKKIILLFLIFIIHSVGFSQWINQYNSPGTDFYDIEFINNKTGWVCGENGTILKTTNAGTNWLPQTTNVTAPLFGIHAVNENIIYCVGSSSTILKTTNSGSNWIALAGINSAYKAVYFINELTGWISGNHPIMSKTTDGGKSFINQFLNMTPQDLYFKDSLNGIGSGGAATIARTSNGGDIWIIDEYFSVSNGSGDFYSMSFINDFTGYIAARNRLVYKTTNFGVTWDSISYVYNSLAPMCIKFVNDSVGYCAGSGGEIFITKDRGLTWIRQTNSIGGYITDIAGVKDSLWVSATLGKIAFTANGGVFIQNISSEIPSSFSLHQNYPNPFNPSTTIRFSIKNKGLYKLEVYNSLGKLVNELFNQGLNTGEYEYKFEGTNLTSGIYFYKLYNEKISETKKMVLLK